MTKTMLKRLEKWIDTLPPKTGILIDEHGQDPLDTTLASIEIGKDYIEVSDEDGIRIISAQWITGIDIYMEENK